MRRWYPCLSLLITVQLTLSGLAPDALAAGYYNLGAMWKKKDSVVPPEVPSSTGTWAWIAGPTTTGGVAVMGTMGVGSTANVPSGRTGGVAWADSAYVWIFAGQTGGVTAARNDLWTYEFSTSKWTWVSGSNGIAGAGTWGTQGTVHSGNTPPALTRPVGWRNTADGSLWLFGGTNATTGAFNTLWKYVNGSGWTWVRGATTLLTTAGAGAIGTRGTAHSSATPPGTQGPAVATDKKNNYFYLYGGKNSGATEPYAGLWRFDPGTTNWTWVSGPTTANHAGSWGTKGTLFSGNTPGKRNGAYAWADSAGNFWLFGGVPSAAASGSRNDLNLYDVATDRWAWITGVTTTLGAGSWGTKGTAHSSNVPSTRAYGMYWTDANYKFWLYGGYQSTQNAGSWADLWMFDPSTTLWTWVAGPTTVGTLAGTYGTKGTAHSSVEPAPRNEPNVGPDALDPNGNLWMFGGFRTNTASPHSDLMRFK